MALSHAEQLDVECPRCGAEFTTDLWVVVDGAERPEAVQKILDGTLHDVRCPHCGQMGAAPAPLLYHDGVARRVLLAVPPGMDEADWREAGQGLLWMLIGAIPESQRAPYLGEVQAEAGLAGVALVIRSDALAGLHAEGEEAGVPPLVHAMQALLAARGPVELQNAMQRYPLLLEPQTITILRELAHEAFKQDEKEAGQGFTRAAEILNDLRATGEAPPAPAPAEQVERSRPDQALETDPLDEVAFALLRSHTGETLVETVDCYPQLLEPSIDAALEAWGARARAHGKPRIADGLDERREALRQMREQYEAQRPALEAVQALLEAESSQDLELVLVEYDALFTDEADVILGRLVETADPATRDYVTERRMILQRVREALRDPGAGLDGPSG